MLHDYYDAHGELQNPSTLQFSFTHEPNKLYLNLQSSLVGETEKSSTAYVCVLRKTTRRVEPNELYVIVYIVYLHPFYRDGTRQTDRCSERWRVSLCNYILLSLLGLLSSLNTE